MNKQLCKDCVNKLWKENHRSTSLQWLPSDDERWKEGSLYCPHGSHDSDTYDFIMTQEPPAKCPYALEHLVLGQTL